MGVLDGKPFTWKESDAIRFWTKVGRAGPDDCWLWLASKFRHGYGQFTVRQNGKPRNLCAHRFAWALHNGRPPKQLLEHICNTPVCVNPSHLFESSPAANLNRARELGRWRPGVPLRGEESPISVLTNEQAAQVWLLRNESGMGSRRIARQLGLSEGSVRGLLYNPNAWKQLKGAA